MGKSSINGSEVIFLYYKWLMFHCHVWFLEGFPLSQSFQNLGPRVERGHLGCENRPSHSIPTSQHVGLTIDPFLIGGFNLPLWQMDWKILKVSWDVVLFPTQWKVIKNLQTTNQICLCVHEARDVSLPICLLHGAIVPPWCYRSFDSMSIPDDSDIQYVPVFPASNWGFCKMKPQKERPQ